MDGNGANQELGQVQRSFFQNAAWQLFLSVVASQISAVCQPEAGIL
jgi:hypothetical protein